MTHWSARACPNVKGLMELDYNVLVFTHFYAMLVCIMTRTIPLSSNE